MLQTQIFTQKYRSWLRFYSEFLRKNLAAEVSGLAKCLTKCYHFTVYVSLIKLNLRNVQEYFAITWNSNTTEINWFDSDFAQTIWAKICWVGALFCTYICFTSECPATQVSTSERPSVHQRASSFANLRNCKNNGGKRFNWFISSDDQFLQAQAIFRTSEASISLQLPKLQE